MIIQTFWTDSETIKKFGFYTYNIGPDEYEDEGEKGIGFICFFFGIAVGLTYDDNPHGV